jgi:hypothetical protein
MKNKNALDSELEIMARSMDTKPSRSREKKRSMPRGLLGKTYWDMQFSRAVAIIEDWGYDVEQKTGVVERVELGGVKTIYINSACHPETRFYTLLHEIGHVLIRKDWGRFSKHYPNYLESPDGHVDGRRERRKSYRIGLIAEEIEAWKRGRNFAERHGLYVDHLKYDSDANAALMSYIDWIAEISQAQVQASRKAAKTRATAKTRQGRKGTGR